MATSKSVDTVISFIPPPYGAVFKVFNGFFDWAHSFGRDSDPVAHAIALLREEIQRIHQQLAHVNERINELTRRVVQIENNNRIQRLSDYTREIESLLFRISQQPSDADTRALIAFDAGALADVFLNDFDLWCWTDIEVTSHYDDYNAFVSAELDPMPGDFKAYPALPVYLSAVMTWLLAIDLDTGSYPLVQNRYGDRLRRHIAKASTRPAWDELSDAPDTFPEHIKARITCYPAAQHKFARNEECAFSIFCDNVMDRRLTAVRDFVVVMPAVSGNILCTADPDLGVSDERQIEDDRGVQALTELADILGRVERTGTLREQFIGTFGITPPNYQPIWVYAIKDNGDLMWNRKDTGTSPWQPAKQVGSGWATFKDVIPAGGNGVYALTDDRLLKWYRHDGFNDGSSTWTGPVDVGRGWSFLKIFAGGDGVVYGIRDDGTLVWRRHGGYADGGGMDTWSSERVVGSGWAQLRDVFSTGQGTIYVVRQDGKVQVYQHLGFSTGDATWTPARTIALGWQNFRQIVPVGDGVILAVQDDGTMLWYKHLGPNMSTVPSSTVHIFRERWEGPLEIGTGWQGFRKVFALMPSTPSLVR